MPVRLSEWQRIPTTGARAVEPFTAGGLDLLAIPQLARDVPGCPAGLNGGDSDTDLMLLRWSGDRYTPWTTLPAPGGEDAEFFTIGGRGFLAVASIRSGAGPYDLAVGSVIYAWQDGGFVPFQQVPTFAAKQWRHWQADGRHFLGLAQGVVEPGHEQDNRPSMVYEWDGSRFVPFQEIPSRWAYNWHLMTIDGTLYVAHAEHLGPSVLYRWDGGRLRPHQELAERGARSFAAFGRDGDRYLLVACLQAPSRLLKWTGTEFGPVAELDGLGARELAVFEQDGRLFVVRVNFVLGTRADPVTALTSTIYEWQAGQLRVAAEFGTTGGTDAALVRHGGRPYLLVSNSLSPGVRFRADTVVYSLTVS
jgi:EPTP domain